MAYRIIKNKGIFFTHYYPQYTDGTKWKFFEYFNECGPERESFLSLKTAKSFILKIKERGRPPLVVWEDGDE